MVLPPKSQGQAQSFNLTNKQRDFEKPKPQDLHFTFYLAPLGNKKKINYSNNIILLFTPREVV